MSNLQPRLPESATQRRVLLRSAISAAVLALTACGSGTGGNRFSTVSASIFSLTATCKPATVSPGAKSQCSATVQGSGNYSSAVAWSVNHGTINSNGLFTASASAGSATVTATSVQDPADSAVTTIVVQSASTIASVSVACNPSTVAPGRTSQCSAVVQGSGSYSSAVNWSTSAGTIAPNGTFTAPAAPGTVTVTATSAQDPSKAGTAKIVVQPASSVTSVSVTCSPSIVAPGATSQCHAAVQGSGTYSSAVSWSASAGTISLSGAFTAPSAQVSVTITATSTQNTSVSGTATIMVLPQVPQSKHVVMVMEENQSYSTVVGQTSVWPNLNNLIASGALPTNYYASTHPSIGNYFMLTTGQILTNDDNSTTIWNVDNLARRMLSAGVSFRVYAEGITQGYLGGNTGLYVIRHNPFAMLSDVADNAQVANQTIWPFTQFETDLASGNLPEFSFIVPDVDDDAHNGTPEQADAWLQSNVVIPLSSDPAFQPGGDGLLIVDFDEAAVSDTSYGGGHVSPVLWGPNVKPGFTQTSSTVYQHPSMLRTVVESLQLTNPPGAASTAPSMAEFFIQK